MSAKGIYYPTVLAGTPIHCDKRKKGEIEEREAKERKQACSSMFVCFACPRSDAMVPSPHPPFDGLPFDGRVLCPRAPSSFRGSTPEGRKQAIYLTESQIKVVINGFFNPVNNYSDVRLLWKHPGRTNLKLKDPGDREGFVVVD